MKITISGTLGSGKSTIARMLAEKLKYNHYSAGGLTRKVAEERNITLAELSVLQTKDSSIDTQIDNYQREIGEKEDNFIMEGRISFHFIPDSIKVFLKCDERIAAKRILNDLRKKESSRINEGLKNSEEEVIKSIRQRRETENKRYKTIYNLSQDDESNFDIIIDTTNIPPEEVCSKILEFIKRKQTKKGRKR
jgi:predicted cytidylate kinase